MTNSQILDAINQNIKRNENKEITGVILNSVLRMLLDFVNQGFITFSDIIQLLADSKAVNVIGSINTTTETTSLPSGVYHAQTSGTYTNASGIVVKEGYYTLLRKKDDGSWVLESEVKMSMQDLTPLENRITENENKVDDFIDNFSVTVDQEFDANSKNPIANSAVTPLAFTLKSFLKNGEFLNISTSDNEFGYIKNDNTIIYGVENKYITISNLQDYEQIYFNGYKAVSLAGNVNNYSTILAILDDNSTVSLLNMNPAESVQTVQEFTINLPNRVKSLKIGWSVYQMPDTNVPKIHLLKENEFKEDSVKEYIDSKVNGVDFAVTLDEENNPKSALSYAKGNDVLKGFFDQTINEIEIKFPTTQGFLYTNNTVETTVYPVSFSKNIPVNGNFLVTGKAMEPSNNVASLLGIKGSVVTNLAEGLSEGAKYAVNVSSSDYDFISIGFHNITPTKIYGEGKSIVNIDAKNYVDERFIVLDSFLNPTVDISEEINMPYVGEITGAGVNESWQQYVADGLFNGSIPISEFNGFEKIKLTGLTTVLDGLMYLAGYNSAKNIYDNILVPRNVKGDFEIEIDNRYEAYLYSRNSSTKFFKIKTESLPIEKDSVKNYIDNNVGTGSLISLKEKAKIAYPENLVEIDFITDDSLPTAKGTLAKGILNWTDNAGTSFKKFATLEVQGSSSAFYPKKNWTFALFNDADYSEDFKLRIGNWAYLSEFVFKSNWIDATHARNILSNKIWEDIVQSRKYFPKRENEVAYSLSNTNVDQRFDSGALCHADGLSAKLFINGTFYGIGMFNIGKKRENYDLKSSNQNHIQLVAETHANFYSYIPGQWDVRNPKTPDANFQTKINAWFASNALNGQAFKDAFETNHVLKNAIEFFLLAEFIQSPDMYTKNLILTSWDGVKFYFLPNDMDTTFGIQWDGASYTGHTTSIRSANFWQKFYSTYTVEIKARYKELRDNGVFTLENVYRHADKMNKTFGVDNFKEEFEKWPTVPSNSTIYTSYTQIYQWVKDRLIWLDSQYL